MPLAAGIVVKPACDSNSQLKDKTAAMFVHVLSTKESRRQFFDRQL
jgi:hypothetical protein